MKFIETEVYMKLVIQGYGETRYMPYNEELVLELQDFMNGSGGNTYLLNTKRTELMILSRQAMLGTTALIKTKTIVRLWGYRVW